MKKCNLSFIIFLLLATASVAQQPAVIKQYIEQYRELAIEEMKRTGVPAAITLAQAIHETDAGRSQLVIKSNNHFGIKCKTGWKGESVSHDDAKGECFRKYNDPNNSYRDHSDFLKTRPHYASLFDLDPTDFEGWCYGLKKAGYATNPKYPQILIKLINEYGLQDYTLVALGRKQMVDDRNNIVKTVAPEEKTEIEFKKPVQNYPQGIFKINKTHVVFVAKGSSYLAIAQQYKVSLSKLFEFNDMLAEEETKTDRLIYLQRKRKEGEKEFHIVQPGETLHDIAQAEGIRLESLLAYNYLKEGVDPSPGRNLYLQGVSKARVEQTIAEVH